MPAVCPHLEAGHQNLVKLWLSISCDFKNIWHFFLAMADAVVSRRRASVEMLRKYALGEHLGAQSRKIFSTNPGYNPKTTPS